MKDFFHKFAKLPGGLIQDEDLSDDELERLHRHHQEIRENRRGGKEKRKPVQ